MPYRMAKRVGLLGLVAVLGATRGVAGWIGGNQEEEIEKGFSPPPKEDIVAHHSMESPYMSDWWQGGIPYFEFGGAAVVTEHFVRLSPDKVSRSGWLWNEEPSNLHEWEAWFEFRVHSERDPGADGLAFWYTKEPHQPDHHKTDRRGEPELIGNTASFKGIGVIFDTYDNDGNQDGPLVSLVFSENGQNHWDHDTDLKSSAKFQCKFPYRNTPERVRARVTYKSNAVTIHMMELGLGNRETFCGKAENIHLPPGYYFGATATTGQIADNHDVYNLWVTTSPDDAVKEDDYFFRKEETFDLNDPEDQGQPEHHEDQIHHEEHDVTE